MSILLPHHLRLALVHPQIAPNTGNVGRLCVASGTELHLVRPLGFVLSDRNLRRSAMDYWPRLKLTLHDDDQAFMAQLDAALTSTPGSRPWFFTSKSQRALWDVEQVRFSASDWLILGSETAGLPPELPARYPRSDLRIPQVAGERCLNLATAAGIALYEALRQVQAGR